MRSITESSGSKDSLEKAPKGWVFSPRSERTTRMPSKNARVIGSQRGYNQQQSSLRLARAKQKEQQFLNTLLTFAGEHDTLTETVLKISLYIIQTEFDKNEQRLLLITQDLAPQLKHPCDVFPQDTINALLGDQTVQRDDEQLTPIQDLISQLEAIKGLCDPTHPELFTLTTKLIEHYQQVITILCSNDLTQKQTLLEPQANVTGIDGVLFLENSMARRQLVRDAQSKIIVSKAPGSHATARVTLNNGKKLWNKPNHVVAEKPELDCLDEASQAAVSNFYLVFAKHDISIRTRYVKYSHVKVQQDHPQISVEPGYIERVAQISEDAQGFSFYMGLKLQEEFNRMIGEFPDNGFVEILEQSLEEDALLEYLFDSNPLIEKISHCFDLINSVRNQVDYNRADKLVDLVPLLDNFQQYDLSLIASFESLSDLSIDEFEYSLGKQMIEAALPLFSHLFNRTDESNLNRDAKLILEDPQQGQRIVERWFAIGKPKEFIKALALCWRTPELITHPARTFKDCVYLPELLELATTLFPNRDAEELIRTVPKLLRNHLDHEATRDMFRAQIYLRLNDANCENVYLRVIGSTEKGDFKLIPVDIDCDRWWGSEFYKDGSTFYVGIRSQLFFTPEVREIPLKPLESDHDSDAWALFLITDWMELNYQRDVSIRERIAVQDLTQHDYIEEGKPSLGLFFAASEDMAAAILQAIETDRRFTRDNPNATLADLLNHTFPLLGEVIQGCMRDANSPIAAAFLMQAKATSFVPAELKDQFKRYANKEEMNISERTLDSEAFVRAIYDAYPIEELNDAALLKLVDQIGRAFPFMKTLPKLVGDREKLSTLLRLAVNQGLPNAVTFLIRCGADVNCKNDYRKEPPLLCTLFHKYQSYRYNDQFQPILKALLSVDDFDVMQKDFLGNTPMHILARTLDDDDLDTIGKDLLMTMRKQFANIAALNHEGKHPFDFAFERENYYPLCLALLKYFSGGYRFATENVDSYVQFALRHVDLEAREPKNEDEQIIWQMLKENMYAAFKVAIEYFTRPEPITKDWIKIEGCITGIRYLNPNCIIGAIAREDGEGLLNPDLRIPDLPNAAGLSCASGIRLPNKLLGIVLKEEPEAAGVQYATQEFERMLMNHGTSAAELFKFTDIHGNDYPVLFSSFCVGVIVHVQEIVFSNKKLKQSMVERQNRTDSFNHSGTFVTSAVLKNGDGHLRNYMMLKHNNLIDGETWCWNSHDSERFLQTEGIIKNENGHSELNMRDVVFCTNKMLDPVDDNFRKHFLKIDINVFLREWFDKCEARNQAHFKLFPKNIINSNRPVKPSKAKKFAQRLNLSKLPQKQIPMRQSLIPVLFSRRSVELRYQDLTRIQDILTNTPTMPCIEILKRIEPKVGVIYHKALRECSTLVERYTQAVKTNVTKALQGNMGTMISRNVLMTQGINILEERSQGDDEQYGPAHAKVMLEEPIVSEKIVQMILAQLKIGGVDALRADEHSGVVSRVFRLLDFSELSETAQRALIDHIIKEEIEFKECHIVNCAVTTEEDLRAIIKNSSDNLTLLNFSGTNGVSKAFITFIDNEPKCETVHELNVTRTDIEQIIIEHLDCLSVLRADDCEKLFNVWIDPDTLKYLHLQNCAALVRLFFESYRIRSIDLRGCHEVEKEAMTRLIIKVKLENIKLDAEHANFDRRQLAFRCVNTHQWNRKLLDLIINPDGLLDLGGFANLTDDDLIAIANCTQASNVSDRPLRNITQLNLSNMHVPKRGLLYFMATVSECETLITTHYDNINAINHGQMTIKTPSPNEITSLSTGELVVTGRYSEFFLYGFQNNNPIIRLKARKDVIQLPDGNYLSCSNKKLAIYLGRLGVRLHTVLSLKGISRDSAHMEYITENEILISLQRSGLRNTHHFRLLAYNVLTRDISEISEKMHTLNNITAYTVFDKNTICCLHGNNVLSLINPYTGHIKASAKLESVKCAQLSEPVALSTDRRRYVVILHKKMITVFDAKTGSLSVLVDTPPELKEGNFSHIRHTAPNHFAVISDTNIIRTLTSENDKWIHSCELIEDSSAKQMAMCTTPYGDMITLSRKEKSTMLSHHSLFAIEHSLDTMRDYLNGCSINRFGNALSVHIPTTDQDVVEVDNNRLKSFCVYLESILIINIEAFIANTTALYLWFTPSAEITIDDIELALYHFCGKDRPNRSHQHDIVDMFALDPNQRELYHFAKNSRNMRELHGVSHTVMSLGMLKHLLTNNPDLELFTVISSKSAEGFSEESKAYVTTIKMNFRQDIESLEVIKTSDTTLQIVVSSEQSEITTKALQHLLQLVIPKLNIFLQGPNALIVEGIERIQMNSTIECFESVCVHNAAKKAKSVAVPQLNGQHAFMKHSIFSQTNTVDINSNSRKPDRVSKEML